MKYFVAFGQFFQARDKKEAHDKAIAALWDGPAGFGISVEECPETEVDPTTGIVHQVGGD